MGDTLALKWYQKGLRTLEDVRDRKGGISLSASQEISLRFYEDLQERIPRQEVELILEEIKKSALKVDIRLQLFPMGSYRRGEESCGDIDGKIMPQIFFTLAPFSTRDRSKKHAVLSACICNSSLISTNPMRCQNKTKSWFSNRSDVDVFDGSDNNPGRFRRSKISRVDVQIIQLTEAATPDHL